MLNLDSSMQHQLRWPLFGYPRIPPKVLLTGEGDRNIPLIVEPIWLRGLGKVDVPRVVVPLTGIPRSLSYCRSFLLMFLNIRRMYSMSNSSRCFSSRNLTTVDYSW